MAVRRNGTMTTQFNDEYGREASSELKLIAQNLKDVQRKLDELVVQAEENERILREIQEGVTHENSLSWDDLDEAEDKPY